MFAAIGALSHEHERAFSASIIYLGLGAVAAVVIQLAGVDWIDPLEDESLIERLTELAVIIALFGTGLKLDRPLNRESWGGVARLLVFAMPLTIGAVALFGTQVMGLSLGAAIVLGAMLAPTDPVLAGDIGVGPPGDEDEHEPNFSITGEAGLNDGLALPFRLPRAVHRRRGRERLGGRVGRWPTSSTRSSWRWRSARRSATGPAGSRSGCATATCSSRHSTRGSRSRPCC